MRARLSVTVGMPWLGTQLQAVWFQARQARAICRRQHMSRKFSTPNFWIGATASILTFSFSAVARADVQAAPVAGNGVSFTLIGIAICGMTWMTHVARQMARERAVRERVNRVMPMRGDSL